MLIFGLTIHLNDIHHLSALVIENPCQSKLLCYHVTCLLPFNLDIYHVTEELPYTCNLRSSYLKFTLRFDVAFFLHDNLVKEGSHSGVALKRSSSSVLAHFHHMLL